MLCTRTATHPLNLSLCFQTFDWSELTEDMSIDAAGGRNAQPAPVPEKSRAKRARRGRR
jgi:hypothetical protein